jgi:hypothetical protein
MSDAIHSPDATAVATTTLEAAANNLANLEVVISNSLAI